MLSKLQDAGSARAVLAPLSGNVQGALQPAAQGAVCKTPPALRPAPPGAGGVLSEVELERLELDRLDAAVNKYRLAHEEAKRALSWDEKSVADVQSDAEGDQRLKKMQKQMEVFRLELVKMEESQRIEEMNKRRIATRLAELAEVKKKLAAHFAAQRAPPRNTAGVNINLARDAPEPIALMTVARGIVIEAAEFESHSSLRRGGCDHESATCVSREDRMAHGRWSSGAMANYLR